MKAMILAAGRGSRLKKFTEDKPKCLVEIKRKPLLYWQLKALHECHITEVTIIVGYKYQKILEYLKKWPRMKFNIVINKDWDITNSAYSARLGFMDDAYIHLNCDIILDGVLLKTLIEDERENILVIDKTIALKDNMEQVYMDDYDKILKMDNSYFYGADGKAIGVAKISKDVLIRVSDLTMQDINQGKYKENFYGKLRQVVNEKDIYGFKVYSGVYEVNTVEDLKGYRE